MHIANSLQCLFRNASFSDVKLFWRTAPYAYFGQSSKFGNSTTSEAKTKMVQSILEKINEIGRNLCGKYKQCRVVDAELLLRSKSFGADRLYGDTPEHFNELARMVILQLQLRAFVHSW